MVPHIGDDSRIFREVSALGAELGGLGNVLGTTVEARVAILFDWDAWRALEQYAVPRDLSYVQIALSWYRPLLDAGVTVDFVRAGADLAAYDVLIVPAFVAASDTALETIDAFVVDGGRAVVGYQSAVLDEDLHVRLGGYLGPLQDTLGLRIEEFAPLAPSPAGVTPRSAITGEFDGAADLWQEIVLPSTAEVLSRFADGFAEGHPAITRNDRGTGTAWYVATQPEPSVIASILESVLTDAGIVAPISTPTPGIEAVRRGNVTFLINHGPTAATIVFEGEEITIPLRDVVLREG
jgi:beta-galactosidase